MAIDISFDDLSPGGDEIIPPAVRLDARWERPCRLCGGQMTGHYWSWAGRIYFGSTSHQECIDTEEHRKRGEKPFIARIPERFASFDPNKFRNADAFDQAGAFTPDSKYNVLAIIGPPGKGKSRLAWHIVEQFFQLWNMHRGQSKWVEYFLSSDLMSEYDQSKLSLLKNCQFAFVDDLGDCPAGRIRSALQNAIRYRVQAGKWSFLTIDSIEFDQDLVEHVFLERATVIIMDR